MGVGGVGMVSVCVVGLSLADSNTTHTSKARTPSVDHPHNCVDKIKGNGTYYNSCELER